MGVSRGLQKGTEPVCALAVPGPDSGLHFPTAACPGSGTIFTGCQEGPLPSPRHAWHGGLGLRGLPTDRLPFSDTDVLSP